MAHLHTGPGGHDSTVSALVFRGDELYVHWHRKLERWLQPGGHVDHDENPWQAVVRELREEAGFDVDQLDVLHPFPRIEGLTHDHLHPTPAVVNTHQIGTGHWHADLTFVFVTDDDPRHPPAAGESARVGWMRVAELADTEGVSSDLAAIATAVSAHVLPHWLRIPAAQWSLETWH